MLAVDTPAILPFMARKASDPELKKKPLATRVPPSILTALQAMADADDRTLSYMVEKAVTEFVQRQRKPKAKP